MGEAMEWPPAKRFAQATCLLGLTVSLAVLAGWLFGQPVLTTVAPGWTPMVPATAATFALAALAVGLLTYGRRAAAGALGAAVCTVGLLRLLDHSFAWGLPLDHLGTSGDGRMAVATATNFILLGGALALAPTTYRRTFQLLAVLVLLIGWLGLARYVYGGAALSVYVAMAAHTAGLFLLFGAATLAARSDVGLVAILSRASAGGLSARRLLPAAILGPLAMGGLALYAERVDWLGAEASLSVLALATVIALGALVWVTARDLDRLESEATTRLHDTVETALDAVITIDRRGLITGWSGQAASIFGWTREEALGRSLADTIIPPQHRAAHRRGLERYLATGEARVLNRRIELTALHRDQSEFPIELAIAPVGRGESIAFSAFVRDIGQSKAADSAMRASEQRFRTLAESLPQLVWTCRPDGWCDYLSRQWLEYTGRTEAEQIGYGWAEQLHPDDRERTREAWAAATARGDHFDVEFRIRRHDGVYRWFKTRAIALRDDQGSIVKWFGSNTDFENEKQAEARLQTQLQRLSLLDRTTRAIGQRQDPRSILRAALHHLEGELPVDFACACLAEDDQGLVVACVGDRSRTLALDLRLNERASVAIDDDGLSRCMRGQLVHEPDMRESPAALARRLVGAGLGCLVLAPLLVESAVFGVIIVARTGVNRFASADCEFLRQLSEHLALAVHQARLHEALLRAYDDLRRSQQSAMQQERLRALGQLASGIAHDINNALSPAAIYTQSLLEHEQTLGAQTRECLTLIDRAIHDVAGTVTRLRDFSRQRDPGAAQVPVDLNEIVNQVVALTRVRWHDVPQERGVVIQPRIELAQDAPLIAGVDHEIRDAVTNLVLNAVDAMPEGGTLTIRTTVADAGADTRVSLEVADTGIGMNEETRARCLEPFFSTKGERGTGLGLAMVYAAARRHGATLEIDSAPARGTTMRMVFPATAAATAVQAPSAVAAPLPAQRSLRLLVIDDDPLIRATLLDTLGLDGHSVVIADGGQAGIGEFRAALADPRSRFDAVLTDLGMPHVDGRVVATTIKMLAPDTPVILLTGWGHRMTAEGDTPAHVDRVLSKPPSLAALRAALAELTAKN